MLAYLRAKRACYTSWLAHFSGIYIYIYVTVFEKMGHPAKNLQMPFLVSINSFLCARNYDIFIKFLAYSVIYTGSRI